MWRVLGIGLAAMAVLVVASVVVVVALVLNQSLREWHGVQAPERGKLI
jgi:hypothetical protein